MKGKKTNFVELTFSEISSTPSMQMYYNVLAYMLIVMEEKEITFYRLAKLSKIDPTVIGRIFKKETTARSTVLFALCSTLGIELLPRQRKSPENQGYYVKSPVQKIVKSPEKVSV